MNTVKSPGTVRILGIEEVQESEDVAYYAIIMERMKGSLKGYMKKKERFSEK